MLYIRYILVLFVSLYTSRVILKVLGVEDYGIYNVVGGFVTLFTSISGAFSNTITRFITYELGKQDNKEIKDIYSTSLIVQIFVGIILSIIIFIVGLLYIHNKMSLPPARINAASTVLIFCISSFFLNLINAPYDALIVAYERMNAYAYFAIVNVLLNLITVFVLQWIPSDKLISYAILTFLCSIIIRALYIIYCKRKFVDCSFTWSFDKVLFKEMMSFTGWTVLGNSAYILKGQGVNMVLNLFGGPVLNAARGLAQNANSAVSMFTNSYIKAIQPQITKLYSSNQVENMKQLLYKSCKISFCLMLFFCVPAIKNVSLILSYWLTTVPEYTSDFIVLILIDSLLNSLVNPLIYGILADGRVKQYEIWLFILWFSAVPLSYFMLKFGMPIISVYILSIFLTLFIAILRIVQSYRLYKLSIKTFFTKVLLRMIIILVCSMSISYFIHITANPLLSLILETLICMTVTGLFIFLIGFDKQEKEALFLLIRKQLKKIR